MKKRRDPLTITGPDIDPGERLTIWRDKHNHVPETYAVRYRDKPYRYNPWAPGYYRPVKWHDDI